MLLVKNVINENIKYVKNSPITMNDAMLLLLLLTTDPFGTGTNENKSNDLIQPPILLLIVDLLFYEYYEIFF